MKENVAYVVNNCISNDEMECLWSECSTINEGSDLSELGASIDLFENSFIGENSSIRIDEHKFFAERWKDFETSSEFETKMQLLLLKKLPNVVQRLYNVVPSLYLFNEHYVVKNVNSALEFRWHTDVNEQLPCVAHSARPQYVSVWCPLQAVSQLNGTLSFPRDTSILCCDFNDLSTLSLRSDNETVASSSSSDSPCPSESDEGVPLTLSAGSVVVFGSSVYHRSGPNLSDSPRLVYYAQYSRDIIYSSSGSSSTHPLCYAIPCHS